MDKEYYVVTDYYGHVLGYFREYQNAIDAIELGTSCQGGTVGVIEFREDEDNY